MICVCFQEERRQMLLEERRKGELNSPKTERPERETPPRPDTELKEEPKASSPPPNSPEVAMKRHTAVVNAWKHMFSDSDCFLNEHNILSNRLVEQYVSVFV